MEDKIYKHKIHIEAKYAKQDMFVFWLIHCY